MSDPLTDRRRDAQGAPLQTVQRALSVLDLFIVERELGIREIARRLNISPAAAHRLVSTLDRCGYLTQHESSKLYRLGSKTAQLAATIQGGPDLRRTTMPYLARLQSLTGETVCIHALRAGYRVCLLQLESAHELRMIVPVRSLPILYGATDQVFRVFGDVQEFPSTTSEGPANWDQLPPGRPPTQADLDAVRERGWAVSIETRVPGGAGVAAPLFGWAEPLAISVFGPKERMQAQGIEKIAADLTATAAELSTALVVLRGIDPTSEQGEPNGVASLTS